MKQPHPLHGIVLSRTIVIGIGSTGLRVLEALQDLWYERFGNTSEALIKLLNIETDTKNDQEATGGGSMIRQIFVPNGNLDFAKQMDFINSRGNPLDRKAPTIGWQWDWTQKINWQKSLGTASTGGAGGIRSGGKVILHGVNTRTNVTGAEAVYNHIKQVIENEWPPLDATDDSVIKGLCHDLGFKDDQWVEDDEVNPDNTGEARSKLNPNIDPKVHVILVGSLTGGTCSGMFIDLGYIVQGALGNADSTPQQISGFFMIPSVEEDIGEPISTYRVNANTFGSLYEIKKLLKSYLAGDQSRSKMPFRGMYIAAPEFDVSGRFSTLQGLVEMVALRIFVNCLGFQGKAESKLTDSVDEKRNYIYTFGIGGVILPKFSLVLKGTNELMRTFCERLTNESEYRDLTGTEIPINESAIQDRVHVQVDRYMVELFRFMKRTAQGQPKDMDVRHLEFAQALRKREDAAGELDAAYSQATGCYYQNLKGKTGKGAAATLAAMETDLVAALQQTTNLVFLQKTLALYEKRFTQVRRLLERQSCHVVKDEIKDRISAARKDYEACKSIDKPDLLLALLTELYDDFVIYYCYLELETVIARISSWRLDVGKTRDAVKEKIKTFKDEESKYNNRLANDYAFSPIVKVFYEGKDKDYEAMKQLLLGPVEKSPNWNLLESISAQDWWEGIIRKKRADGSERDLPYASMSDVLKRKLHQKLYDYLHPGEGGFEIVDKALEAGNKKVITSVFDKVRAGFLRRKLDPTRDNSDAGRIPRNLISDAPEQSIRRIINSYSLDATGAHEAFENGLVEDMLIYTRDIPSVELEQLEKFDVLKEHFLHAPKGKGMDNDEWTQLRLTLNGEVDYTIIHEQRNWAIEEICRFIGYFWFARNQLLQEYPYPVPRAQKAANGDPSTTGCLIDSKNVRRFCFLYQAAGMPIVLNVDAPEWDKRNELCKDDGMYGKFLEEILRHTTFGQVTGRDEFVNNLYRHYHVYYAQSADPGVDKAAQLRNIFWDSSNIDDAERRIKNATLLQSKDCLIGHMMNILK